jgi:hypothetical protein
MEGRDRMRSRRSSIFHLCSLLFTVCLTRRRALTTLLRSWSVIGFDYDEKQRQSRQTVRGC